MARVEGTQDEAFCFRVPKRRCGSEIGRGTTTWRARRRRYAFEQDVAEAWHGCSCGGESLRHVDAAFIEQSCGERTTQKAVGYLPSIYLPARETAIGAATLGRFDEAQAARRIVSRPLKESKAYIAASPGEGGQDEQVASSVCTDKAAVFCAACWGGRQCVDKEPCSLKLASVVAGASHHVVDDLIAGL